MKRLAKSTASLIALAIVLLAGVLAGRQLLEKWTICSVAVGVNEHVLADAVDQQDAGCTPDVDCGLDIVIWPGKANQDPFGPKRCAPCLAPAGLAELIQEGQNALLNGC